MLNLFKTALRNKLLGSSSRRRKARPATVALESLESRLLLTSLNLNASTGLLIVGGGAGADNDLTISFAAGEYTFTENTGQPVTVSPGNALFPAITASGAGFVTFNAAAADAAVTGAPGQITSIRINAGTGDDILTVNGFRAGSEGLDVRNTAGQGTDTIHINADIGSSAMPVASAAGFDGATFVAETINLGADIWTTNKAVRFTGPTTLTADTDITTGSEAVTFAGTLNGASSLLVNNSGLIDFTTLVGNATAPTGVDLTGSTIRFQDDVVVGAGDLRLISGTRIFIGGTTLSGTGNLIIAPRLVGANIDFLATDALFTTVIQPGFSAVTLGSVTTGTLRVLQDGTVGSLTPGASLNLIGNAVHVRDGIDQGANALSITTNSLLWQGKGAAVGTGSVTISKLTAGGTLTVTGNMGSLKQSWGANDLIVSAAGSSVSFLGAVGNRFASIDMTADNITFNNASAVSSQGDITLTGDVSINGGIHSGGGIDVDGGLTLNRNALLKAAGGSDVTVSGITTANGNNIIIRGVGGPIGIVDLGNVVGAGTFKIDSGGGNTALSVNLDDVDATDILVKSVATSLDGTLTASAGNISIAGSVSLTGDTTLVNTSVLATRFIRVDGTINGAMNFVVDAGIGRAIFAGDVGGMTPLDTMTVTSGGHNTLNRAMTVENSFSWTVGTAANGISDRLAISGAGSVTVNAVAGTIDLEADVITGDSVGVNLVATTVSVIERGAGD